MANKLLMAAAVAVGSAAVAAVLRAKRRRQAADGSAFSFDQVPGAPSVERKPAMPSERARRQNVKAKNPTIGSGARTDYV